MARLPPAVGVCPEAPAGQGRGRDARDEWREKIARIGDRVEAIVSEEESDRITGTVYPDIRTILSDKLVREVKFIEQ